MRRALSSIGQMVVLFFLLGLSHPVFYFGIVAVLLFAFVAFLGWLQEKLADWIIETFMDPEE
jgi:ABC-type dipeptide/oligopeptide/nickel transport system permease component